MGALASSEDVGIAAPTWLETSMVLAGRGHRDPQRFLEDFGREFRIESIPFTAELSRSALRAWQKFGRGNHAARLNFGDCISYATATASGRPLLFVGDDFSKTDVVAALS